MLIGLTSGGEAGSQAFLWLPKSILSLNEHKRWTFDYSVLRAMKGFHEKENMEGVFLYTGQTLQDMLHFMLDAVISQNAV